MKKYRKLSRKYESLKIKKEKGEATRQNIQKHIVKVQKLYKKSTNIKTDYKYGYLNIFWVAKIKNYDY